jgi:hypothetical protein
MFVNGELAGMQKEVFEMTFEILSKWVCLLVVTEGNQKILPLD